MPEEYRERLRLFATIWLEKKLEGTRETFLETFPGLGMSELAISPEEFREGLEACFDFMYQTGTHNGLVDEDRVQDMRDLEPLRQDVLVSMSDGGSVLPST
jgi:hypothetical protein